MLFRGEHVSLEKNNCLRKRNYILSWAFANPIKTIVLVGVLLRVLVATLYGHITIYPDSSGYLELAHRLLSLDLHDYDGSRSPGYPFFISLVDVSTPLIVAMQMAIGIVTLVFIYKTLLIIRVNKRKSLIYTLLWACYIPTIFFELAILSETLTLCIITLAFYVYFGITMQKRKGILSYLRLSVLCGFLVLIKPFYIIIPTLLFFFLIINNYRFKIVLLRYLIVFLLPVSVFLGWSYVNKMNTGYFTPTTFAGYNIAQNCVNFAEKTTDEYKEIGDIYAKYRIANITSGNDPSMSIWDAYDELRKTTGLSFADLSHELYNYSITTIAKNPGDYLSQVFMSWTYFWKTSLYWELDSFSVPYSSAVLNVICYAERVVFQLVKLLFVLLMPYNIIWYLRKRKYSPQFIITLVVLTVSLAQAFVTFGTNSRFSFPFEALMLTSVLMNYLSYRRGRMKQKS